MEPSTALKSWIAQFKAMANNYREYSCLCHYDRAKEVSDKVLSISESLLIVRILSLDDLEEIRLWVLSGFNTSAEPSFFS